MLKEIKNSCDSRKKFGLKKRGVFPLDGNSVCATLTTHPDDYIIIQNQEY